MRAPTFHAANFFTCEAFAKYVFAHQILFCGLHIGLGLNVMAQIAQHLHRTLIGDMRAWCVCQPTIAVHHHIIDAIAGQQCRARGACRACADDKNVCRNLSHYLYPPSFDFYELTVVERERFGCQFSGKKDPRDLWVQTA